MFSFDSILISFFLINDGDPLKTLEKQIKKKQSVYMSVESRIIEDGSPGEESDGDGVIGDGVVGESGEKKVDEERESRQDETEETNPFHARLEEEHFTFSLHID